MDAQRFNRTEMKKSFSIIAEHGKAEETLASNRAELKAIYDHAPVMMCVLDADRRVLYANSAFTVFTGISEEHLQGGHACGVFGCINALDDPRGCGFGADCPHCALRLAIEDTLKTGTGHDNVEYHTTLVLAGGSREVTLLGSTALIQMPGQNRLLLCLHDITDRVLVEQELRESEEKYRSLASTVDSLFVVDRNCRFLFANESFLAFYGPQMDSIIGRNYDEFHDEETSKTFADVVKCVFSTGNPYRDEWVGRRSGNCLLRTFNPVKNTEGIIFAVTVASKDITDRKQAEEELKESESKFRSVAEQSIVGISIVQDGRLQYVNQRYAQMHDYRVEEMEGMSYIEAVYPDDRPLVEEFVSKRLRGDIGSSRYECRKIKKNGEPFSVEIYGAPTTYRNQPAAIGVLLDITDRKNAEKETRSLEQRLQRAEKMEALGTLAGGVAHDLNNVLGVLSGYSEMLVEQLAEGSPLKKYAANILKSSQKGAAIIQDLLTLARRGVVVATAVDLNNVIASYLATPEFERLTAYHPEVAIKADLAEDLLNIMGSPVHLEKTVMNLVSNAAEAIAGSGAVHIGTENRYLDHTVHGYDQMEAGDYVVLTVSDTGGGISAADLGKIFEPFYTKKSMGRSGTGLGLAIVWGTVKDHQGYIDVESTEGEGTTFTLYFPVTREKISEEVQQIPREHYLGQGETVLVVDDVQEQRQVATALLTQLGYRVNAVSSGKEAVAYLQSDKVDILVLDMIMDPGIDGLDTYKLVLDSNPHQKAILVSGFSETDRVREAQQLGAGLYVKKPYLKEKIGIAIRDTLAKNR